jgi:hypothetical protein
MARAQQGERMRHIGVLIGLAEDDPETKARLAGFRRGLEKRGWTEGRNVRFDYRFAPAGAQAQVLAKELVALQPDVPSVYYERLFVASGGLMSYGVDFVDLWRQAASYVDRILRGDNPADLPVQAATKFETTVNLKTAKALGLTVPPGLLVAADEVIE